MLRKFACLLTVAIALSCVARAQAQLPSGAANREATLNYLERVKAILEEELSKVTPITPLEEDAKVYRSIATQIRRIPDRGVDPQVRECARRTANWFSRKAALAEQAARAIQNGNLLALVFLQQEEEALKREAENLKALWDETMKSLQRRYNVQFD
jgi:hypothetical protein